MMLLSATYKNHINNILNIIKGFEASGMIPGRIIIIDDIQTCLPIF